MEDEEPLETRALVGQLADAVQHEVHDFLPDRVVPTCVVVRSILLAGDQLLRMEQLAVGARANLVYSDTCINNLLLLLYLKTLIL